MRLPEVLAPAGSMEALIAAVRCGADAVYVGGTAYSARSSAANFTAEQLCEAVRLCHLYGAKLYLTVNTLLTDTELPAFRDFIRQAADAGIDACIVQDLGALEVIRAAVPEMPLHASTQMSIHTPEGARQAAALGCCRVVAAREMSQQELAALCRLPIEVEVFVHGALCMSVSGQCSFSALVGGRSANRGRCAQACRLPWKTPGGKNPAALSLRDLSLVQHADALRRMGVTSLKIEGRMKRPEYVAAAVTALRQALAGEQPDMEQLQAAFSRSGFTDGYFTGKKKDMFGYRRKEDVLAGQQVLRPLQELYRKPGKAAVLDCAVTLRPDGSQLTASDREGHTCTVQGDVPAAAQHRPLDVPVLMRSLHKLGDTVYAPGQVTLDNPEGLTLPAAQCNALRRAAVTAIDAQRIAANTPHYSFPALQPLPAPEPYTGESRLRLHIRSRAQLADCTGYTVCLPPALAEKTPAAPAYWIEAPRVISDEAKYRARLAALREQGYAHLLCHNLADIRIGGALGYTLHGGFGLGCTNSLTADSLRRQGLADVTASWELRTQALHRLGPVGAVVYGRAPMMLLRVCPIKAQEGCRRQGCYMTDRTGRRFPLVCSGDYVELCNAQRLWLADKPEVLGGLQWLDLYFMQDEPIGPVLRAYAGVETDVPADRTTGLYCKGGLL